jgi:hypothetical protein
VTRRASLAALKKAGFHVAPSLPVLRGNTALRPLGEIASRLMALDALFTWVSQLKVQEERVRAYAERSRLPAWMTTEERAVWNLGRRKAHDEHVDVIGWRLENMWPLAWILGFSREPSIDGEMISEVVIRAMGGFLPKMAVDDLLSRAKPRREAEVLALEDLFYCAHNAARSAQLGGDTVPPDFDPIASGGVVHERRHALTWATSPGVAWDDTDLST